MDKPIVPSNSDRVKMRAFKLSEDSFGAISMPLTKHEIDRFIAMGWLELNGFAIKLTNKGNAVASG